uniref:UPAR/Ly6 domain-containing protein n=1 Tax=Gasterosteus aculeatus aculeatus TaxID=481459 RepID=A0AAQ4RP41_GASAC
MFKTVVCLLCLSCTACGLTCYSCEGKGCTNTTTCPSGLDHCNIKEVNGVVTKSCMNSALCVAPIPTPCCSTDLCNGATPAASSILLLMASSAIVTLFL